MITVTKPTVSRVLVIVQAHRHTLESVSACKLCTVSGSKKLLRSKASDVLPETGQRED